MIMCIAHMVIPFVFCSKDKDKYGKELRCLNIYGKYGNLWNTFKWPILALSEPAHVVRVYRYMLFSYVSTELTFTTLYSPGKFSRRQPDIIFFFFFQN